MVEVVDNWKAHLGRYSVQALTVVSSLQVAWLALPSEIKEHLPSWSVNAMCALIAIGGLAGAFIKQKGVVYGGENT